MSVSEQEANPLEHRARKIIREYYATFYPGLAHVYTEHLKGQVDFIYNNLVKEGSLEKYLKEYQILTEKYKKVRGIT